MGKNITPIALSQHSMAFLRRRRALERDGWVFLGLDILPAWRDLRFGRVLDLIIPSN